jgi:hypothetical protein
MEVSLVFSSKVDNKRQIVKQRIRCNIDGFLKICDVIVIVTETCCEQREKSNTNKFSVAIAGIFERYMNRVL